MRQFKLWNYNKSASFDFASQGIIITEVAGLGINYSAAFNNRALVQYEREFEPITLLANFGINANAYGTYNSLANFVVDNGKNNLILEYSYPTKTMGEAPLVLSRRVTFEAEEGFTARTDYMNTQPNDGIGPYTWFIYYGTSSTTGAIEGLQSLQMRYYTTAQHLGNIGYAQTNYKIKDLKRIRFRANSSKGLGLELYISADGQNYIKETEFNLTSTAQQFEYALQTSKTAHIRFKLKVPVGITSGQRVVIDEVEFYTQESRLKDHIRYADVWLTRMPKSQKTNFNLLSESLQFARVTPWYVEVEGTVTSTPLVISNTTLTDIAVNLTIKGPTSSDFAVELTKIGANNPTSEIRLNYTLSDAYIIKIDADNKKVEQIITVANAVTNGYNWVNKEYDTFIIVPPGSYQLTHTGTAAEVTCNYKGWVID